MSSPILYALLSLTFAAMHDVVFKRYAKKDRSRGTYIACIGLIWLLLQLATAYFCGDIDSVSSETILFGVIAGLFLTASNLMLLESMTHIDASMGSTIYRLNTLGVVVLAVLFLNEPFRLYKGLGILAGVVSVILLYRHDTDAHIDKRTFAIFFAIAVAASLFRALYGVTSKAGLLAGADIQPMLMIAAFCWMIGGSGYALLREKRLRLTRTKAIYSLVSGILVFLIVNFLLLAIEHGEASTVIPIANMSFVLALVLSIFLGMERFTMRKLGAILTAACSIILLSMT
ncbi:MAG: EamA/RhaT family transporter [Desulfuromonas sp.]|nr:MAG: EamA/RhaT family transporter [Desulfuromonas sp.]